MTYTKYLAFPVKYPSIDIFLSFCRSCNWLVSKGFGTQMLQLFSKVRLIGSIGLLLNLDDVFFTLRWSLKRCRICCVMFINAKLIFSPLHSKVLKLEPGFYSYSDLTWDPPKEIVIVSKPGAETRRQRALPESRFHSK